MARTGPVKRVLKRVVEHLTEDASKGSDHPGEDLALARTVKKAAAKSGASVSKSVKRTSDVPVQQLGQGIQGNRHDVKSGSGMGIK